MKKSFVFTIASILLLPATLFAETHLYEAANDFPVIDAADTPFYKDRKAGMDILAINASVVAYREKFARAETVFSGTGDTYDLTLTTLGEIDGDCVYQILIDGEIQATVTNAPTDSDYALQTFVVEDIPVPSGATIAVEAMAVSNGLIPEHDAFAYARGRWLSLQLDSSESLPESVDLQLDANLSTTSVVIGDEIDFELNVNNLDTVNTATGITATIDLPVELAFVSADLCTLDSETLTCDFPEIAPEHSDSTTIKLTALSEGEVSLTATIRSDQHDSVSGNNESTIVLSINPAEPEPVVDNSPEPIKPEEGNEIPPALESATSEFGGGGAFFLFGLMPWFMRKKGIKFRPRINFR